MFLMEIRTDIIKKFDAFMILRQAASVVYHCPRSSRSPRLPVYPYVSCFGQSMIINRVRYIRSLNHLSASAYLHFRNIPIFDGWIDWIIAPLEIDTFD